MAARSPAAVSQSNFSASWIQSYLEPGRYANLSSSRAPQNHPFCSPLRRPWASQCLHTLQQYYQASTRSSSAFSYFPICKQFYLPHNLQNPRRSHAAIFAHLSIKQAGDPFPNSIQVQPRFSVAIRLFQTKIPSISTVSIPRYLLWPEIEVPGCYKLNYWQVDAHLIYDHNVSLCQEYAVCSYAGRRSLRNAGRRGGMPKRDPLQPNPPADLRPSVMKTRVALGKEKKRPTPTI